MFQRSGKRAWHRFRRVVSFGRTRNIVLDDGAAIQLRRVVRACLAVNPLGKQVRLDKLAGVDVGHVALVLVNKTQNWVRLMMSGALFTRY